MTTELHLAEFYGFPERVGRALFWSTLSHSPARLLALGALFATSIHSRISIPNVLLRSHISITGLPCRAFGFVLESFVSLKNLPCLVSSAVPRFPYDQLLTLFRTASRIFLAAVDSASRSSVRRCEGRVWSVDVRRS